MKRTKKTTVKYTPNKKFDLHLAKKKYKVFREVYNSDKSLVIIYKELSKDDWEQYEEVITNLANHINNLPEAFRLLKIRKLLNMLNLVTLNILEEDISRISKAKKKYKFGR